MKKKGNNISYKLFILGALVLFNIFVIYDLFSSNPILNISLVGHIPFFFILLPSSLLTIILNVFAYISVKNSKIYSKNSHIKAFLAIAFIMMLFTLVFFLFLFLLSIFKK